MRNLRLILCGAAFFLLTAWHSTAQWVTQTLQLKPGWNSVCVWIQPVAGDLNDVLGNTAVRSVWQWDRRFTTVQFQTNPTQLLPADPHWQYWYPRTSVASFLTSIKSFVGSESYLIELPTNAAPLTISLKGLPILPAPKWVPYEMNFVGFPSGPAPGPYFLDYFRGCTQIDVSTTYNPSIFTVRSSSSSLPVTAPARTRMERGVAYWVRLQDVKGFVAPFTIEGLGRGLMDFGTDVQEQTFTIANASTSAVQVVLSPAPSESPPSGQPALAGAVPLSWYNVVSFTNRTWVNFNVPFTISVPASGKADVRLAIRRGDLGAAAAGALFQSLVNVQDTAGRALYQLPVRATPSPSGAGFRFAAVASSSLPGHNAFEGLWLGEAQISSVNHPVSTTNGWDATTLSATLDRYPVRLILHVDGSGAVRLLQRVIVAPIPTPPTNQPAFALYSDESLVPAGTTNAARISSTTLHYLPPQLMGGTFFDTNLTCAINLDYNDPLNPFKHLYHPDHDNLTSDYSTNAPAGAESWSISRTITLAFSSTTNYPSDPMWGTDLAGGVYSETVSGLREYPVRCAGYFGLRRVNRVNVLQ
ncbi:MAG: hypothetical protein NT167_26220 [Verrucomicrobia bacterium]|nr:hypothetical protein [Verrucomicrobiota bacterium]